MTQQSPAPGLKDIVITAMSEHDLLEVVEIEEESRLSRWGWTAYYAELQSGNRDLMLIARRSSATDVSIAGYIVARETAGELHINNVAVRPGFRRRGIGAALLERVIHEARRRKANTAFLEVRSENHVAQSLYEKCGFRPIARRSNYYSDPVEDAIIMSLVLG